MMAKTIGTAITEEAAIFIPGIIPWIFIKRTPKKTTPIKAAQRRPRPSPSIATEIPLRTNSAAISRRTCPRPGMSLTLRAPSQKTKHSVIPATTRTSVSRLNWKSVPSPKNASGKKSWMPGAWGACVTAGIHVAAAISATIPMRTLYHKGIA